MGTLGKVLLGFVGFVAIVIAAAFYFTSGVASKADDFFVAVSNNDYDKAYSMLSEEFKKNANKQQLKDFLEQNNLTKVKETSWNSREIKNGQGKVQGKAITETGGNVPLTMHFVKGKDDWLIYSITKSASGLQDTNQKQVTQIPNNDELLSLVQATNKVFTQSVAKQDMMDLYNSIAQIWQKQSTPAQLTDIFKGFYQFGDKILMLNNYIPAFTEKPFINDNGFLQITGDYPQLKPKLVTFTHKYIKEGLEWKLTGFTMNIK